jgi:hypothetical protein
MIKVKWDQTLFEKEGMKEGRIEMEGVNLFKVYYKHVWNYHNETLLCY